VNIQVAILTLVDDTEDCLTLWCWGNALDSPRSQPFWKEDEAEIARAKGTIVWCDVLKVE